MTLEDIFIFCAPANEIHEGLNWDEFWNKIKSSKNHLEVILNCFGFIRDNELIDDYPFLDKFHCHKQIYSDASYYEIVFALKQDEIITLLKDTKLWYVKAYKEKVETQFNPNPNQTLDEINDSISTEFKKQKQALQDHYRVNIYAPFPSSGNVNDLMTKIADWLARRENDQPWFYAASQIQETEEAEKKIRCDFLTLLLQQFRFGKSEEVMSREYFGSLTTKIKNNTYYENKLSNQPQYCIIEKIKLKIIANILDHFIQTMDALAEDDAAKLLTIILKHVHFIGSDTAKVLKPAWERLVNQIKEEHHLYYLGYALQLCKEDIEKERKTTILKSLLEKSEQLFSKAVFTLSTNYKILYHPDFGPFHLYMPECFPPQGNFSWNVKVASSEPRPIIIAQDTSLLFCEISTTYVENENGTWTIDQSKLTSLKLKEIPFYLKRKDEPVFFWNNEGIYQINFKKKEYWTWTKDQDWKKSDASKKLTGETMKCIEKFGAVFNVKRKWRVIYSFHFSDSPTLITFPNLMSYKSGFQFSMIGRADNIEGEAYKWRYTGKFPETFKRGKHDKSLGKLLGKFIGLDPEHYLDEINGEFIKLSDGSVLYYVITVDNDTYVRVNLPRCPTNVRTQITEKNTVGILKIFQFEYYRKVIAEFKVEKKCKKNNPRDPFQPSLPIDFGIDQNHLWLHTKIYPEQSNFKKKLYTKKYKYNELKIPDTDIRKSAKQAMGNKSATAYTKEFFNSNTDAKGIWKEFKSQDLVEIPTDQEWCHLHGNHFNGPSKSENFVSGSKHCNTEQLAIESAQSLIIKKGIEKRYELRSTAYLFQKVILPQDKVPPLNSKKRKREAIESVEDNGIKKSKLNSGGAKLSPENEKHKPVAAFMRYKILVGPDNASAIKLFDYTFEGQSEFFDKNQYHIIYHTAHFVLAGLEAFGGWFIERFSEHEKNTMDID